MAFAPALKQSYKSIGMEERVQLTGERTPRFHGVLTTQLEKLLECADTSHMTYDDLEHALHEAFEQDISVKVSNATRSKLVFANDSFTQAVKQLAWLDAQCVYKAIIGLEEEITRRQQQGDYWPEGRLNIGIAYACLGEYADARRWLDDAVNMLRYPSSIPHSEQRAS